MKTIMTLALLSGVVLSNANAEAQATRLVNAAGQPAVAKTKVYQVDQRWQQQNPKAEASKGENKGYEVDRRWQHNMPLYK